MTDTPDQQDVKQGVVHDENATIRQRLRRFLRPFLGMWYVHPDITVLVYASPNVCLGVLAAASKPSTERLHLRNLFANGRRYYFVDGSIEGFRMVTTSKIPWRRRDRTNAMATLVAKFNRLDDELTQIHITAQIRIWNLWGSMMIPVFFTPLILFAAWQPVVVRIIELVLLYGLAWSAYRYNAAIDAHDMVYFIQKALEDFMPKSVQELGAHVPHVVDNRGDFPDEWDKFYEEQTDQSD